MHFREKKSVREIVRFTNLPRNTVRNCLKKPVLEEPKYRRSGTPRKLIEPSRLPWRPFGLSKTIAFC